MPTIEKTEKALQDPKRILFQIGVLMQSRISQSFKNQKRGSVTWKERGTPNVIGILKDFDRGVKNPPMRRFEARPALKDTGALSKSIAFETSGNRVEIGTVIQYAGLQNWGGETQVTITGNMRSGLNEFLKKARRGEKKERAGKERAGNFRLLSAVLQKKLGWLLNESLQGATLYFQIPARPFAVLDESDMPAIAKVVSGEFQKIK